MEFLDFQIWSGPWIWKFGWKCGMVKDLALWFQEFAPPCGILRVVLFSPRITVLGMFCRLARAIGESESNRVIDFSK